MINIVIAAGYATRLGELTKNFPKPLLEIGKTTILGRMLDDIDRIPQITEHVIVTNHKFAHIFEEWAAKQTYTKPIRIIDDGTDTNETRLGAVCDLILAINALDLRPLTFDQNSPYGEDGGSQPINALDLRPLTFDQNSPLERTEAMVLNSLPQGGGQEGAPDLLVVAADNILHFSFQEFVDYAYEKQTSCIMCHEQPSIEKLQRTGVVVLDENNKVLNMEEKPQEPKSHWAVPPFYIYMAKDILLILDSINNGCGKDAPGNLAHYMVDHTTMHAWPMSAGRFDIGSLDTYEEAKRIYG